MYWNLLLITLIPIFITIGFYFLTEKTKFNKLPYIWQQIIIGVVFGLVAISGTEFGVPVNGATANVRDAAPLLAGLMFGGPAGIIAGALGGVERFFAAYWGRGTLTQIACSLSTLLAGFYAAALRKYFFENKRPRWGFAFAVAIVMEVFHFVMVFVTNFSNPTQIMTIIKALALPMIIANGVAVLVPALVIQIFEKKLIIKNLEKRKISDQVKWWLLGSIVVCYLISSAIVYVVQTNQAYNDADNTFALTISDITNDVVDSTNEYMLEYLEVVKKDYDAYPYSPTMTSEEVMARRQLYNSWINPETGKYDLESIDVIQKDPEGKGVFVCSSTIEGFEDMSVFWMTQTVGGQSYRLHKQMTTPGVLTFVQEFCQRSDTSKTKFNKYAAIQIDENYYLAICINEAQFYPLVNNKVGSITRYRHVNKNGHILIMDSENRVVSDEVSYQGKNPGINLTKLKQENPKENVRIRGEIYGEDCFFTYKTVETYTLFVILPYDDVLSARDSSFILNTFMQILCYAALFILIYILTNKLVVKKIEYVSSGLNKISNGELEVTMNDNSSAELISLTKDINNTVDTLKRYIEEAKKRIDDELAFAKTIQLNALPSTFPAFPDKTQFDVYATMDTAKEVGGDFYDFYIIDNENLAFLIADVSGKGIPAAMFMMEGKAIIKNLAKLRLSPEEVLTKANDALAQNNEASMFITCWFGVLNFKTGHVRFANAGHNAPLIYKKDGSWDYIAQKKNIVLAAMEGMNYQLQEFDLMPGDRLYLYTDGVTEATRGDKVLYGEERLSQYLNNNKELTLKEILLGVKSDIDLFIDGADQFDDITMVGIEYIGDKQN